MPHVGTDGSQTALDHVPFLCFLQVTTGVAEELVALTQHLACAELPQTCCDTRVLFNIDRQIEERLVSR